MSHEPKPVSEMRLMQVLLAPRETEKTIRLADKHRQFVFKVARNATKHEVKQAVELLFKVKVNSVQVVNIAGKRKRFGSSFGKRPDWKKAYVGLEEGHDINLMNLQ